MDEPTRRRVRGFHQWVTFLGGCLLVAGALAAGYLTFFREARGVPTWLMSLAKLFHRLTN